MENIDTGKSRYVMKHKWPGEGHFYPSFKDQKSDCFPTLDTVIFERIITGDII